MHLYRRGALAFLLVASTSALGVHESRSQPARVVEAVATVAAGQSAEATACTFSISPASGAFMRTANTGTFIVQTQPGCAWTATTQAPWITLLAASGVGSGTVLFTLTENTAAGRSAEITVAAPGS